MSTTPQWLSALRVRARNTYMTVQDAAEIQHALDVTDDHLLHVIRWRGEQHERPMPSDPKLSHIRGWIYDYERRNDQAQAGVPGADCPRCGGAGVCGFYAATEHYPHGKERPVLVVTAARRGKIATAATIACTCSAGRLRMPSKPGGSFHDMQSAVCAMARVDDMDNIRGESLPPQGETK